MRKAGEQLDDLVEFFGELDEGDLRKPHPERRGKTVGDAAAHVAEGYHFMQGFLNKEGYLSGARDSTGHGHGQRLSIQLSDIRRRLNEARSPIASLAELRDDQLDSVPPAKSSRFSDGRRTLEQVIEAVIAHQTEHLRELESAVA
jgi:hypothetical protein